MAGIEGIINIKTAEYRHCEVDGKRAFFHRWNEYSRVVEPSPMIGGAPGGQISYTRGMVEFEDGTVQEISPHQIKFLDTGDRLAEADGERIAAAKTLLEDHGYVVIQLTDHMRKVMDECVEMAERGEDRDCCGCPCSVCVLED